MTSAADSDSPPTTIRAIFLTITILLSAIGLLAVLVGEMVDANGVVTVSAGTTLCALLATVCGLATIRSR